jgi:hypothetical protein
MKGAAIGVFAFAATLGVAARASAQTGSASIETDLHGYYRGEQIAAAVVGGIGLAAAGSGAYLVTRRSDFGKGLGASWLAMGSLEAIGAAFYAFQVGGEIDRYQTALAHDPSAYRAEEIDHMRGTSARFPYYRAVELALTLAGAGMAGYGLAAKRDAWTGTGVGVASLSLPVLVIDGFNDARARRYLESVQRFQATMSVAPANGGPGAQLWLSGRF